MAIISKNIEHLKPNKEYIVTVRAKNNDINALSGYTDSIRFQTPTDATTPSALTNLKLYAGLENVMFVFDYSQDLDVRKYEYELYENSNMSDEDGPLTGFADANVFTVKVSNLQLEEDYDPNQGLLPFWGRARTIDTTGNVGPWTSLVQTDPYTPLIDNQYIGSLTASKITAGTIGAHTITLNSASSIIKSSTFNGTLQGNGSYSFPNGGGQGWLINGQGKAYFYDATIVGSIDIGGFDSGSFHVDIEGNMWLGAGVYGEAPFRVSKEGVLQINQTDFDDIVEGIIDFNERNNRNPTTPDTPTLANTITAGSFNIGSSYKIVSLTGTSQAQWNTAAGTADIEYAIGSVFTADGAGAGTGTVSGETIDHDINDDGSVDISFEWNYTVSETPSAANNIDGFAIYYYTSPTLDISAVTPSSPSAGSVTYTTLAPHGFAIGNTVVISDLVPVEYNGTFTVTAVTSTTFRVANSTTATVTNAVGSVFGNTAYTIGASPSNELVYFLPREKRALILQAVPSNKFYTFGVKAYRIVDTNLELPSATVAVTSIASNTTYKIVSLGDTNWNTAGVSGTAAIGTVFTAAEAGTGTGTVKLYTLATSGILYSAAVQSTVTEENPYQPSTTVAFKGDVTGTINQVDVVDITTTYNNFNSDNDRFDTTPASATGVTFVSPTTNFDGSINLTMDWDYPGLIFSAGYFVAGAKYNIISLGTTTEAQWNTIAGTSGKSYIIGSTFTASSGAQEGTGTAIKHANSIDGFAIYLRAKDTILVTAITTGTEYEIVSLGNTTTAQWNTVGVAGTAVLGTVFTASSGTRVGDGRVIENTQANITDSDFNSIITSPPLASDYSITVFYLTPEKSAITFPPLASDKLYRAAIRAYRMVDTDINSTGIIYGSLVNTAADYHKGLPIIGGDTGITIGNGKIYIGIGNYNNTDTGFYVDSTGKFSLEDKLTWNGTDTLSVTGAINATSGTFNNTITVGTNATKINIVGTSATTTTAIYSGTTGYGTGTGFWMDASGRFS